VARFDPVGLATRALRDSARLSTLPLSLTERQVMRVLRWRLESAAPARPPAGLVPAGPGQDGAPLPDRMNVLLDRALEQTPAASRKDLYEAIIVQLVPDEARILAALSDGSAASVVNVYAWSRAGILGQPVLANASLVGRTANVTLPRFTPVYVGHLLSLGLVSMGPEDPSLKIDYEILMAEDAVRAALEQASLGPLSPRVERQTMRLSELGRELWVACGPTAVGGGGGGVGNPGP
jgi:hypothetical protein